MNPNPKPLGLWWPEWGSCMPRYSDSYLHRASLLAWGQKSFQVYWRPPALNSFTFTISLNPSNRPAGETALLSSLLYQGRNCLAQIHTAEGVWVKSKSAWPSPQTLHHISVCWRWEHWSRIQTDHEGRHVCWKALWERDVQKMQAWWASTLQRLSCVVKAKLALHLRVWGRTALLGSWMSIWSET